MSLRLSYTVSCVLKATYILVQEIGTSLLCKIINEKKLFITWEVVHEFKNPGDIEQKRERESGEVKLI